jgi:AcrR family transcriptional regulator
MAGEFRRKDGRRKLAGRAASPRGRKPRGTRWQRRKEARPQEILSAALRVFAKNGFAAARIDDIAAEAGIAKGTVYLYFDSKEAMFKGLLRDMLGARLSEIGGLARGADTVSDMLAQVVRALGHFASESELVVLPKMVIAEAGNFPDLARIYREEVVDRGLALLGGLIREGIARGEFRDVKVDHAVRLAIAPVLLVAIWRTTFAQFDSQIYDYAGLFEAHAATLLRGLAKDTPP